ncbi:sigma-70 family rna polymerase sigma factor : RNA polymerase sigma factor, sigma-70 family OS=Singulisphaera acidiphila (strain ATCC BAA-1392 / DSM 18658 / VKM B-2454 / MOB10) GN=Sinac_6419 PE=4 SV=1: Sigma70_r2: Sigma70_r4_2 [Gemmata massiliana]|uniref:RNA polymerase sigma-70 region 2 domain-containing protein n=1 Tax=Gemmata massiliana TaxID=1210884 RepID=A0A6P2D6L9_9BACT|nr:sigma-70 family RNA polymerase sigma factor [Gemmata massiliana]VTR96105.1 sigma-70 family rna polymerase sigma factor : RNA polymerase sigma factor, sigma-70 family OS=Singulisphaera acidiphila (strain ATCC BAA-1392 / DSM 18658 / VKM B-2454 / MOB10) GN=Sinac_6419 PE=4 SV=1: Sigma70_r2: Sigma70_r4_2 [Gemmata massiliana]
MADAHALARLATLAHTGLPDHALLNRFASDRDECAFATLVERHGPVVLDVARAVLRHAQDAEDVFQASFLVLARNASTIRTRTSIGCWLHGVARRIALKARRSRMRRARHEAVPHATVSVPGDELTWGEVRVLIHDELARLPDALRAPVLLCHLEGLTLDEAAARLELSRSTLRRHLDRARAVLRQRLARRGLAAAAITFPTSISNAVPPLTVLETARSAVRFAAGFAEPTRAVELANGAMSAMTAMRMKLGLLLVATFSTVGVVLAGIQMGTGPQKADLPTAPAPVAKPADKPLAKSETDDEKLQGAWTVTGDDSPFEVGAKWVFKNGRLERPGEKNAPKPEAELNTWYKLDPKQNPRTIDLTYQLGTDGPVVFTEKGIYAIEGNELKFCTVASGKERPKSFSKAMGRTLILKREPPAKATFLEQREGKPPMRTVFVSLELTNTRSEPVWLLIRYSGDKPLPESGKFLATENIPQAFVGDRYAIAKGSETSEVVRVSFIGGFQAFYLAPESTVRFDRYPIECWKDVDQIEVWEVPALRVNGNTVLEEWLPYRTKSDINVRVPADAPATNLDWDARTAKSRTDYPKERVEFVRAEPVRKWLLPIKKPEKTPLEALQGTWYPIALEFDGLQKTGDALNASLGEMEIKGDTIAQSFGDYERQSKIKIDATTNPKSFDLLEHPTDAEEKRGGKRTGLGIYDLTGDTLTMAVSGEGVRPTGFKTTADSKFAVYTYTRKPPAKPEKAPPEFVSGEATLYLGREGLDGAPEDTAKKQIPDKAVLAKFLACFPELGRGKEAPNPGGLKANITFRFTDKEGKSITVYSTWTEWSEGQGVWPVKTNLMKLTGELFERPILIDRGTITGLWEFVKAEKGGQNENLPLIVLRAIGDKLILGGNDKLVWDNKWGINYAIDPSKSPKEIDLVFLDGAERRLRHGIYTVKDNALMICFDTNGKNRPTEFNTTKSRDHSLWVFKRWSTETTPASATGDLDKLRKKLRSGTPEEKLRALTTIHDLQAIKLIPDVIEAIADPTALPRESDTGWGFVGHQAATVMCELARVLDGTDRRGRRDYTFHDDQYKGGEKLKELGRLEEVRKNWSRWHIDRK